jgi:ribosome-associated protein
MDSNDFFPDKKSKTQKKREMLALQELGEELARLNAEQLAKIPLTDELHEAIRAVQGMSKHGARYRQMQYIGRLMREADVAHIQEVLDILRNKNNLATAHFHQLEKWRDQLIAGNEEIMNDILRKFSDVDIHHLRQLVRNAQKEQANGKALKTSRGIFGYLKELQEETQKLNGIGQMTDNDKQIKR